MPNPIVGFGSLDGTMFEFADLTARQQVAKKVSLPEEDGVVDYGEAGYVLMTNGDGTTEWVEMTGGGEIVRYTITRNLTNCTSSSAAESVRENRALTEVITLDASAELSSVTITMSGINITSSAWNASTRTISIASVTGNVVITVVANVVISETISFTGTGTARYTGIIDATQYDLYWEVPFEDSATQLADGTTAESTPIRLAALLFEDAAATTSAGYYYIDTGEIETAQRIDSRSPDLTFDNRVMVAPSGYYVKLYAIRNSTVFSESGNCFTYLNAYANTVYLTSGSEPEPEPEETISNARATDMDLLQMYTLNAVSLNTSTVSDATSYAGVLEEAKNAWMLEYSGNINKIPLICHADQHDSMNPTNSLTMWETIDNMISWYDVSKVINFGDTTNSYDNYDNPDDGDANLEEYLEATVNIPFSKRIEIFGNHDCMKIISGALTYIQREPYYLSPYFKNVMTRRTSNNGYHVTYDPYFNVKYIVYSNYDYSNSSNYNIVSSAQYDFLIEEMSKNDGYDIILCGHQHAAIYREYVGTLAQARFNKTSGTFTDREGNSHSYDFTGCENDLLVCLHGHDHSDAYDYNNSVLSQCFANYYDSTRPIYFVIVDRINHQLKAWKVTNTPEYTTYTRPFEETT